MSNIYIQEPPTNGKVILFTSVGDIEIELWSREAPKACRNFVQLCLEGYYDKTVFHRLVKEFIVQGGDPTGTGEGGESVYGKPFKDEFHSRLRFVRRGLVAMANSGPHDNGSQFFFTLGPAQELQNKHTIFGKVVGDTIYNMIKLAESDVGSDERPAILHRINKTKVIVNPFDDIVPRVTAIKQETPEDKTTTRKSRATKNFSLLSFGEEAEEDELETEHATTNLKIKSSHDVLDDPTLSRVSAIADILPEEDGPSESTTERIRKKLTKTESSSTTYKSEASISAEHWPSRTDDVDRVRQLQKEAKKLKRELTELDKANAHGNKKRLKEVTPVTEAAVNDTFSAYRDERSKYQELRKCVPRKGTERANFANDMFEKYNKKLQTVQNLMKYDFGDRSEMKEEGEKEEEGQDEEEDIDLDWSTMLSHKVNCEENQKKVLDANIYDAERYDISDPRNPITKRRRDESKHKLKQKKGE